MLAWVLIAATFAGTPSIDEPLRTGAASPQDAAVVVGLERYAYVSPVPYAERDAQAFQDFLLYTRGVPLEKVRILKTASAKMIERAVAEAIAEVGAGGTLWFYFAGHGAASPSDGSRLLLADDVRQDPVAFAEGGVRVEVLEKMAADAGVQAVLVLDTCYSGLGRAGDELVDGKRFAVPAYASSPPPEVTVWTAASGDELSGPFEPAQHGMFSYFAVGALRGWADGELTGQRDGSVTNEEAQAYVLRALRSVGDRSQTPTLAGDAAQVLATRINEAPPDLAALRSAVSSREGAGDDAATRQEMAVPLTTKPSARRTARAPLILPGLVVTAVGSAVGVGTWALTLGEEPPPESSVVPLKVGNAAGWSVAGVGAILATVGLVRPAPDEPLATVSFGGRF